MIKVKKDEQNLEEAKLVIKNRDHEEYVLNAVDDLLSALDECAWAQVLPVLSDAYRIKARAEQLRDALKDHEGVEVNEDGSLRTYDVPDDKLYPRHFVFNAEFIGSILEA